LNKTISFFKNKKHRRICIVAALLIWYWFCIPSVLFSTSTSSVLLDKDGKLLCAQIAADGQWRFPTCDSIPKKFEKCIVQFEDRNFYYHPGVNPLAIARAIKQNIFSGKTISGGSTITMQVMRMARNNKSRTIVNKLFEIIQATRIELTHSKKEILNLYASNAPFGTNVVGLEAAAWRYYGRNPFELSWGEMATLAVLPNSPSLIHPGKNRDLLFQKRNRLLQQLFVSGEIDSVTLVLSQQEPLPDKPYPLPQYAPHLLNRSVKENGKGKLLNTTINLELQLRVNNIVEKHHKELIGNKINNIAALVLNVETGNVLAYTGNTKDESAENGNDVDVINAPRSTGSILKPFLFAAMLNDGELIASQLIADVPTQIAGYSPKNFNLTYDGAIPAKRALARSLNVPIVKLLQEHGVERFHYLLKKLGMSTISFPANHYGLSLILGGAEGKLWDIAGIYASMARTLNNFTKHNGKYNKKDFHPPQYLQSDKKLQPDISPTAIYDAASIYLTFDAMVEVSRPDEDISWRQFSSSSKVAWKTGTSFGFRDGWAVGVTPQYVVAVWVGNADGEGRPELVGVKTAAPIMFDIFNVLKPSGWFSKPFDEMRKEIICKESGYRASEICVNTDSAWIQLSGENTQPCPYHQIVHLDKEGKYRVNSDCENTNAMQHKAWLVLPPSMEWYYKSKNPTYKELPPWRNDCAEGSGIKSMELIYPKQFSKIYVPLELDGKRGKTVFEAAHRKKGCTIYWHLDNEYIGETKDFHQMGISPQAGKHLLTLVDEKGETLKQFIEIVDKE
jgi:penicillin-binding protein 1C